MNFSPVARPGILILGVNMKVYVAQLNVLPGRPADNFKAIKAAVALAKKAGADMVVFPENAIPGNPSAIGMRQNEAEFQKACSEAERSLQKLSKGIEILVGSSEGFDECMYSHYVDGNMDGWDHDFEVYSGHQEFLAGKDEAVTGICSRFARNSKKAVLYVNAVGTENSGKNIYALDGGSRLFDNTGKEVFRMPQLAEAGMMFEISKGKVKALPCGGKTAPESFKPGKPIAQIHDALVYMIRENLKRFHIERMVIGASGGIDSAVSAVLYAEAIGAKNVYLVNMPTKFNSDTTKNAARDLAKKMGCPYMVAPISDMLDAVSGILAKCMFVRSDKKIKIEGLAYENLQARTRSSSVLLSVASVLGAGVTCNGNKSEATAGYCTLYGDTCGVMCALGDLWKTQVYELARYINRKKEIIPAASIDIPASAELSDAMNVDEGKGDPIKYPYHDKLFAYWVDGVHGLAETEELLEAGTLCKVIGADPKYFKKLFKTKAEALEDMRAWHRRFRGLALAKRIQFPPILSVSGMAFGGEYTESQG